MNTTSLFVEHLITGVLTLTALSLLLISFIGLDIDFLKNIFEYETFVFFFSVALAYPLGIFTDNLADVLLEKWDNKLKQGLNGVTKLKILRRTGVEDVSKHFTYTRSRIRIARSSAFNFLFLSIAVSVFIGKNGEALNISNRGSIIAMPIIFGLLLSGFALWNWRSISKTHHAIALNIWKELEEEE